ncbi:MAG: DUF4364 family protein [Oscillospiraceae bacterium]
MAGEAFSANVKPGGLTSSAHIRVLLCYLIKTTAIPLTKSEIEYALLSEELVNYFELADALQDLIDNKLATLSDTGYALTDKGRQIADTLVEDLPRSVRECAINAVIQAQQFARKKAQHKADIEQLSNGCNVHCHISDMGGEVFNFSLYLPDMLTAKAARDKFVNSGSEIYSLMLAGLTGNKQLAKEAIDKI